jgi:hypothetical protein
MLHNLQFHHGSKFWRAIYIVWTVLVCSYIFFDVLDLDGSNFPLKQQPLERTAIVPEVTTDADHAATPQRPELRVDFSMRLQEVSCESAWLQLMRISIFSCLVSVRGHGYRVSLPRSSIDPFQYLFGGIARA